MCPIWGLVSARETGLEPATSAVTGQRSNQLSYSRIYAGEQADTSAFAALSLPCVEGGSRTHDLSVMNATLLPAELPRRYEQTSILNVFLLDYF